MAAMTPKQTALLGWLLHPACIDLSVAFKENSTILNRFTVFSANGLFQNGKVNFRDNIVKIYYVLL